MSLRQILHHPKWRATHTVVSILLSTTMVVGSLVGLWLLRPHMVLMGPPILTTFFLGASGLFFSWRDVRWLYEDVAQPEKT